jgi:hypothetical protein
MIRDSRDLQDWSYNHCWNPVHYLLLIELKLCECDLYDGLECVDEEIRDKSIVIKIPDCCTLEYGQISAAVHQNN